VSKTKEKDELASDLALLIVSADINTDKEELELLEDLHDLNGANENSLFHAYWDAMAKVVELDGSGAERRHHAEGEGLDTTTKICYAPALNSLKLLHKATLNHLKYVENKKEGTNFAVPSTEWCRRQVSPYRETSMTAETFTGRLPIKRVLQAKNLRLFHAHAHHVAQMKKIWRHHVSKVRCMFKDCEMDIGCLVDVMPWYQCIVALGQDDKAKIPVAIHGPIAATDHSKVRAFVENDTQVHASDHDWSFLKIAPSVTSMLNIGRDPGESLFSGGKNGQGEIPVSLHNSNFYPSTSRHHAASMIGFLREKARTVAKETQATSLSEDIEVDAITDSVESFLSDDRIESFMLYVVLLEIDGGPDHNIKLLRNCISLLAAFLVGNMDKLVAVRGCPGHSYSNTVERCMSILNLGLTNLGMRVDFDSPDWLFDLLEGNGSMKKLRDAIALYDSDLQQAIIQREKMESQKQMWEEIDQLEDNEMVEEQMTEEVALDVDEEGVYPEGYITNTFFDTWGWYEGEVTSNEGGKYTVHYPDDGETHEWSQIEMDEKVMESNVAFGAEGYRFVKMFPGASGKEISVSGIVDGITGTGMRKCSFSDGKNHTFSLSHMKLHCNKNYNPCEGDSDDCDDSSCSGSEANTEDEDANTSCSDTSPNNDALDVVDLDAVIGNESDEDDEAEEEFFISKGKYFYELIKLPLVDLRARGTAHTALAKAMEYPINQITDRFCQLTLSGRPVKVTEWLASEKMKS